MSPKLLLDVLLKKWSDMPKPVRIGTYIVFLVSYIYLLFTPQYIDGQLKAVNPQTGNPFPMRHQVFEMYVDGRSIRFVTDGRGRYAIPKPSKLPLNPIELWFFPEGMEAGSPDKKVLIPVLSAVNGRADILSKDGDYFVYDDETLLTGLGNFFISAAHADEGGNAQPPSTELQSAVQTAQSSGVATEAETSSNDADEQQQAIVSREISQLAQTSLSLATVNQSNTLQAQGISNKQMSMLLHQVENQYDVVINTNRQAVQSIEDIAEIVNQQQRTKTWQPLAGTSWVKPKGLFGKQQTLQIQNTTLKIQSRAVAEDSAEVQVLSEENGEQRLLFSDQMFPGERITVKDADGEYAIELEKVDSAGLDRIINPKAAYLNVKAKQSH